MPKNKGEELGHLDQAQLREIAAEFGDNKMDVATPIRDLVLSHIKYVTKAPSLEKGTLADIDVVYLNKGLINFWHNNIQPYINKHKKRSDYGWNWYNIEWRARALQILTNQNPCGFAIVVPHEISGDKVDIPVVMIQLVANYPHLDDNKQNSSFLWYFSNAPEEALLQIKDPDTDQPLLSDNRTPKLLGSLGLDTALIHSILEENAGRLGLHAAPKGGKRLFDWYLSKEMMNLPTSKALPNGVRSVVTGNDGRYFCYNKHVALKMTKEYDKFR